jgi:hypothetical protein
MAPYWPDVQGVYQGMNHRSAVKDTACSQPSNSSFTSLNIVKKPPLGPYQFITDNQGLIHRVITSLACNDPYPNSTLAANWDVVNKIVTTLQTMPIEQSFQHVKGHQDGKIAYDELPLHAKLNVDTDAKAGEYRYYHPERRASVP